MNKIFLVAALATTILGSIATIQTAEALCPEDNPDCCPPQLMPYCAIMVKPKPWDDFPIDRLTIDQFVYQGIILDDFRTTKLIEATQVQQAQIVNMQKDIETMKGVIIVDGKVDRFSGGIIIDGLIIGMLGAVITIGIVNLRRRR